MRALLFVLPILIAHVLSYSYSKPITTPLTEPIMKLMIALLAAAGGTAWLLKHNRTHDSLEPGSTGAEKATVTSIARSTKKDEAAKTSDPILAQSPTSEYLDQILEELNTKKDALNRHTYLMKVVDQAYKDRATKSTGRLLEYMAELHIEEFPEIQTALKKDENGDWPQVPTFRKYAIFLAEHGRFDRAIEVCQKALEHELKDGTKGGFEDRIARIKRKQVMEQAPGPMEH